jgi:hypothetical protein
VVQGAGGEIEPVDGVAFAQGEPEGAVGGKVHGARTVQRGAGEFRAVGGGFLFTRSGEGGNEPGF